MDNVGSSPTRGVSSENEQKFSGGNQIFHDQYQHMSWLLRIVKSQLEAEWWTNIQHHLDEVMKNFFVPMPPKSWPYDGDEPAYIPTRYSGKFQVGVTFHNNELFITFGIFKQSKQYDCKGIISFDKPLEEFLKQHNHNPYMYLTDRVTGFEKIQASITGATCVVKRRGPDKRFENAKTIGSVDLLPQETTPYSIMEAFRDIIINDWGDDGDEDEIDVNDPSPIIHEDNPSVVSPVT